MNVTELLDSLTGASQPPTLAEMIRAYLIATAGLGVTCFVAGMLPRLISFQIRSSRSLILSFCLCCGAGVLLATAMVHILPEISEKIPNLAAVVFCAGFLMLFFIDEMVHFWCSSKNGDYEDSKFVFLYHAFPTTAVLHMESSFIWPEVVCKTRVVY